MKKFLSAVLLCVAVIAISTSLVCAVDTTEDVAQLPTILVVDDLLTPVPDATPDSVSMIDDSTPTVAINIEPKENEAIDFIVQPPVQETPAIFETPNLKVIICGKTQDFESTPLIIKGRTMLPFEELLYSLGIKSEFIELDDMNKTITINGNSSKIVLTIDTNIAKVIKEDLIELDAAPFTYIKDKKTYIPLRFVAENLGKVVLWDDTTKTVTIMDTENESIESSSGNDIIDATAQIVEDDASPASEINILDDTTPDSEVDVI